MPKTYTVKDVAEILGYSTNSIYTFLKEKRIKGVRLGKGRFRIPEEELARILHLAKKSTPEASLAPVATAIEPRNPTPVVVENVSTQYDLPFWHGRIEFPNFFDWFVGMAAFVAGGALFLFNGVFSNPFVAANAPIVAAMKIVFMACGLGLIVSNITAHAKFWRYIFLTVLAFLGGLNAVMLTRIGDIDGGVIYGIMALTIVIVMLRGIKGIAAYGIYVSLLFLVLPIMLFIFPQTGNAQGFVRIFGIYSEVLAGIGFVLAVLLVGLFWVGYAKNGKQLFFAVLIIIFLTFGSAFGYAVMQYWSRAFFMIVVGLFAAISGYWRRVELANQKRHLIVLHALFVGIGLVFVCAILIVYVLQRNIWETNKADFYNKITTGQNVITSALTSVQSSLVVAAQNPALVTAIEKKDASAIAQIAKVIYESNKNMRRIVFIGKTGDGLALYPYGTFETTNFAFREYFTQVRDTKRPYISDLLQSKTTANKYGVAVAVPVLNAKDEFVGLILGSVDLDRLGLLLAQVSVGSRGEYFVVVDDTNTIIFHPDAKRIGSANPSNDPVVPALSGQKGVMQGQLITGALGMVAYAPVPMLGWGLSLRVPVDRVYGVALSSALITVGIVAILALSVIWIMNALHLFGWRQGESGP
jgi:excisionase family DNA binding protein